jgi:predicted Zn-dependent protease
MRALLALALAGALSLSVAACGFGDEPPISDAEREVGRESHQKLLAEFGGAYDGDEAAYLRNIGEKVAQSAGLEGQCRFTLVNSDVVNAFAVPGCYIYVTRGLVSIVNSEGELASVLAHEVGHIAANHSDRQQRRSILRSLGVLAVSVLTGSENLSSIASAAAGYFTLRYSRKHEYEADDLGLKYLRDAGYDPYAAADMLAALGRHTSFLTKTRGRDEARSIPEWAMTHPLTQNRVDRARDNAGKTGLKPNELPENEAAYMRTVDGLLYGDDPEQGFVIGRRFAHPIMRIAFEAPDGYSLTNSPQAILIEGPDGLRGEFAGGPLRSGGLSAYSEALLSNMLRSAPVELGQPQRAVVNGLRALITPAMVRTQEGAVTLTLAAYDAGDGTAYHFLMVTGPSASPQSSMQALFSSFRMISTAEAQQLRPRRIEVVRVGQADTIQSLARQMASEHPVEHFLMLNGRQAAGDVRAGGLVKLVVNAD